MADAMRAMLDELMGKDRDLLPDEKPKTAHFTDPEVCKYFICGFCPHDLFINTKSDLGHCPKVHDESIKEQWVSCENKAKYSYEEDWIRYLERVCNDLDRKMKRGYERLDLHDDANTPITAESLERIEVINKECDELNKKIEQLGEEGLINEATVLMKKIDKLKAEKDLLSRAANTIPPVGSGQEKRMRVCEVCGALLVVGDTEKRTQSHLEGKQHIGFQLIRQAINDYNKKMEWKRDKERKEGRDSFRKRDDRDRRDSDRRDNDRRDSGRRESDRRDGDRHRDDHRSRPDQKKRRSRSPDKGDDKKRRR